MNHNINLLYITPLWTGMQQFFFDGKEKFKGMPAFYNVFNKIINSKDFSTIHILLFIDLNKYNHKKININKKYDQIKIYPIYFKNYFNLFFKFITNIFKGYLIIKKHYINVIYSHGSVGALGSILSLLTGINNVQRIYGTFLINELEKSKTTLFFKHPFEYLSFSLYSKYIVITNDGTHGDVVHNKIGNKKSKLIFLLNGVNKTVNTKAIELPDFFVSYIARIDRWKRQDILLNALLYLKKEGVIIPAIVAGPVIDANYYNELISFVKQHQLNNQVTFPGGLTNQQTAFLLEKSKLTLSLYDTSNLGNIFLEAMVLGTPMIAFNVNNSLDNFPKDVYCNIKDNNPQTVAKAIKKLWESNKLRNYISNEAKKYAKENLLDWDTRVDMEIKLLY